MSLVFIALLFLSNATLMERFGLVLGQKTCNSNSDCRSGLCCKGYVFGGRRKCVDKSSCVGRLCSADGDCGGKDECCNVINSCTTSGCRNCNHDFNCGSSEYCCTRRYHNDHHVCRRSCVGETCRSTADCGSSSEFCDSNDKCVECSTDGDCSGNDCCLHNKCVTTGCTRCSSNSECSNSEYCCKRGSSVSVCRKSCIAEKCSNDNDCGGPGESCDSNKCALFTSCSTDGDCTGSDCCLNNKCVTTGCTRCSSNSGCSGLDYCCKRGIYVSVCRRNCAGAACSSNSDCGGPGESCHSNKCKNSSKLEGWAAAAIVVGAILFVIVFGGIPAYCCLRRYSQRARVVRQQASQNAIAMAAVENTEACTGAPPQPPVYNALPSSYYNTGGDVPPPLPKKFPPPEPLYFPKPQPPYFYPS